MVGPPRDRLFSGVHLRSFKGWIQTEACVIIVTTVNPKTEKQIKTISVAVGPSRNWIVA